MEFIKFRELVRENLEKMMGRNTHLFVVNATNEEMWETYLSAYEEGAERQSFTCNCCKSFIRQWGNIVEIGKNGILHSIWDVDTTNISPEYKSVVNKMTTLIYSKEVNSVFFNEFKNIGTKDNTPSSGPYAGITWNHFYCQLQQKFVKGDKTDRFRGEFNTNVLTFKRAVTEISRETVETVLELINSDSLYRGDQYKQAVQKLKEVLDYLLVDKTPQENLNNLYFAMSSLHPQICSIRNSAIGTLLVNIEEGMELEEAVKKYEVVTAPTNYRRTTAIVTPKMVKAAEEKVTELGLMEALPRRHAVLEDLTINDVLFANREAKKVLSPFENLAESVQNPKNFKNVEEISLQDFIEKVLPTSKSVELFLENRLIPNFLTLTAPINKDSGKLFKWNNNFSWSYSGDVTDSIKEKVKAAGGNVEGVLRCSLSWHNYDDLDIHCVVSNSDLRKLGHIYYSDRLLSIGDIKGTLDVDMNAGSGNTRTPVENIIFSSIGNRTKYKFYVNNFSKRESVDNTFEVEIEFAGEVHTFSGKNPAYGCNTYIAEVSYYDGRFTINPCEGITHGASNKSKEVWNLATCNYVPVSLICNSPNYWGENNSGTKHVMFMLKDCKNPNPVRGFYSEFLVPSLNEHRKVFEILGDKMKAPYTDNQLSGIGFITTSRNHVFLKVTGNVSRVFKVNI